MPSISQHQSLDLVKGLVLGDAGAGKTGGLLSLVKAGYKLRIYDFDNLLGSLTQLVLKECPELADNVKFQTFTDKMKGVDMPLIMNGGSAKVMPFVSGTPDAFVRGLKQLNHWKYTDPESKEVEDLGNPAEWGKDTIVVIDTLTTVSAAAFRYAQAMNPAGKEQQAYYFSAQQMVTNLISLLCSKDFATNVLVLAHINYDKNHMEITKGFPRSIGSALNDQIAAYFNCVLAVESQGSGAAVKRQIRTNSTGIVDLKNPVSFKVPDTLPLETGLATFFKAVTTK
jgi:hypothetical protein